MRVKNVKIAIKSLDDMTKEAMEVMEKLSRGEKVKKHVGVYFENVEAFRKVLTDKRLELLHTIRVKHPFSIYALSKMLGRDEKNVTGDLNYLKEVGLVELKKSKEGRERTILSVPYEKIQLEISI